MKRMILTGILALATGLTGLMALPQAQPAKGPTVKSKGEGEAVNALFTAAQAGNADATIKAADDLVTKFSDTEFKEIALQLEATTYQQKGDPDHATIYGERVLEINPKNFQITLMGEILAQRTRENDLDKEDKLSRADKYLNATLENLKTATKPNPQLSDQQWEDGKKYIVAETHNGLGLVALVRKKYDLAITEFKTAVDNDPQPAYSVRLASAYQSAGKNEEAIAICDKLLADPQLHPQIKQVAQSIKTAASQAKK